jgi:hypothetical protein
MIFSQKFVGKDYSRKVVKASSCKICKRFKKLHKYKVVSMLYKIFNLIGFLDLNTKKNIFYIHLSS